MDKKNGWTYTWENLPTDGFYSVKETKVTLASAPGEDSSQEFRTEQTDLEWNEDGTRLVTTITNAKTAVKVSKVWDDNWELIEGTEVEVTLKKDGEIFELDDNPATLNAENQWTYTWNGLPDGKYTVEETWVTLPDSEINMMKLFRAIPSELVQNENGVFEVTITNELKGTVADLLIQKFAADGTTRKSGAVFELWAPDEGTGSANAWDENTVYRPGDVVTFGGQTYTALHWNVGSYVPGNQFSELLWKLGSGGTSTTTTTTTESDTTTTTQETTTTAPKEPTLWSSSTIYNKGDRVIYEGKIYEAQWYSNGVEPPNGLANGQWILIDDAPTTGGGETETETETETTTASDKELPARYDSSLTYKKGDRMVHTIGNVDYVFEAKNDNPTERPYGLEGDPNWVVVCPASEWPNYSGNASLSTLSMRNFVRAEAPAVQAAAETPSEPLPWDKQGDYYVKGALVTYNGQVYRAKYNVIGTATPPSSTSDGWEAYIIPPPSTEGLIPGTNIKGTMIQGPFTSSDAPENEGILFDDLGVGTYYLYERTAPEGCYAPDVPFIFTVDKDGVITFVGENEDLLMPPDAPTKDDDGNNRYTYGIKNHKSLTLPDTGGVGTTPYTLAGITILAFACLMYKKRQIQGGGRNPS